MVLTTLTKRISEEDLVKSLKENRKNAFEYLYDNYSGALYGIIYKIIKDEEKAQDLMQDVFIKIWRKISDYDPSKGKLFTWMVNIARNTSIDLIRKEKNIWLDDIEENIGNVDKISNYQQDIATIDLKGLLEKLRPERKVLVDMVYLQGYTQEEAAERLQIPLGTAKSRIRTALQDLKTFFEI